MLTTPSTLLQRLRQPAEPAQQAADWARFVQLYTPLLYQQTRRLSLADADAADLVQEVFLRLVRKLPDFQPSGPHRFRAWLHTVLLHCWRDQCQRRARPGQAPPEALEPLVGPDPVEELAEAEYRRCLLGQALQLMQRDFQERTWRACWETVAAGRPAAAVAAELGLSRAAVYAATARVLRRLRQELEQFLD